MNNELVYRLLLLGLFAAFVGYRGYCTRKYGKPAEAAVKQRQAGLASKAANLLALPGLAAVVVYAANPAHMAWSAVALPDWARWLGVALAALGFALLHWSHTALAGNWSDTPRLLKDQTLVTHGPYRLIRHPIYAGFLLIMSATLFISANWFIGLMWAGMTALETVSRMAYEESLMIDAFGDQYRAYMRRTGRLLPRIAAR